MDGFRLFGIGFAGFLGLEGLDGCWFFDWGSFGGRVFEGLDGPWFFAGYSSCHDLVPEVESSGDGVDGS